MDGIGQAWNWFASQNLAVQALVVIGILNTLVVGFKAMGWTYLADECQKIENALQAMVQTTKTNVVASLKRKDTNV